MSSIKADGTVVVDGKDAGRLEGFVFIPLESSTPKDSLEDVLDDVTRQVLSHEISGRVKALSASADLAFKPDGMGQIFWRQAVVARFVKGENLYQPMVEVHSGSLLNGDELKAVQTRLNDFAATYAKTNLEKATALKDAAQDEAKLGEAARRLADKLYESLGTLPTQNLAPLLKEIGDDDRRHLTHHGVRFGLDVIYMMDLLKPAQIEAKALLWSVFNEHFPPSGPPPAGRVAIDHVDGVADSYWLATGYRRLGGRVMRVDMAERLAAVVRGAARGGKFQISDEMMSLAGATREQMAAILKDLNCQKVEEIPSDDAEKPPVLVFERKARPEAKTKTRPNPKAKASKSRVKSSAHKNNVKAVHQEKEPDPNSPFAILAQLKTPSLKS